MRELIAIVSFAMAFIGALATIFIRDRDKQTMSAIVGAAFLVFFFINVPADATRFLQIACLTAFATSMLGGAMAMFSRRESSRTAALVTSMVSLLASLLILFLYT